MIIDNFDKNARTGVTNNGSQKDSLIEYLQDRVKALELEVKTLSIEKGNLEENMVLLSNKYYSLKDLLGFVSGEDYKELAKDDIEVNNDWKHTDSDGI
jgi:hypothetical protein